MKKLLVMLLAAIMILALSACGNETTNNENGSSTPEPEQESETLVTPNQTEVSYDASDSDSILASMTLEFESATQTLTNESTDMLEKVGETYGTYDDNKNSVTDFYNNALKNTQALYASVEAMSIDYFKSVAAQGLDDYDIWNDAMEDFYDVWDEGMEDYYDTWDGIYEDIYDKCDDLIEDASDDLEYSEYSDAWSEMYENYSDSWSAMYEAYSDSWSNIYSKYSAVWSGFYNDNTDVDEILKAAEEAEQDEAGTDEQDESGADSNTGSVEVPEEDKEASSEELVDGMRPEFKEAMDSYEAFWDEYYDYMKKLADNPTDMGLLAEYSDIVDRSVEMDEKFAEWDDGEMNDAEMKYYLEVSARIMQKASEALS